ncbi:MAG: cbb3-type cytochrome oxidase assembly protein CcoS [Phycisphaerales bacterium]|nr:cbb3-type cytochrome oxidase assembly protein CcoS [Phycisphaerales bacterium]
MSVIFIALPVAIGLALSALLVFIWATRAGQFDDLDTPPLRMLHDATARDAAPHDRTPPAG